MTEENHQTESSSSSTRSSPLVQPETQINTPDVTNKNRDVKKEKCRAMSKVVIRRLPPSMNQAQFIEQISPLPEHDYLYFVKADMSLGQYAFSRVYINFIDQRDIFIFREKFDNYVFVDSKGTEYPAVVEFAPFQRLPKKRAGKKKDVKCGSIESDPYYISFLESLQNSEGDAATAQPKTEYSYQPADNTLKKVTTTPLLEYLKQRKQEKQRLKDEKREERRRRDIERRRAKDEPTISKVLKNPEMEKEAHRELKDNNNKEEREKQTAKDAKNRNKREDKIREKLGLRDRDGKMINKQQQQQQTFSRERGGDDRNRERDAKHQKKHEDKRSHGKRDDKEREGGKEERKYEGKYCKEDKRTESKDEPKEQPKEPKKIEEKRGKSYEKMRLEKKRLAEIKKGGSSGGGGGGGQEAINKSNPTNKSTKKEERETSDKKEKKIDMLQNSSKRLSPEETNTSAIDISIIESSNGREKSGDFDKTSSRLEQDFIEDSTTKSTNRRKEYQDYDADINCSKSRFHEADCSMEFEDQDCSTSKKNVKVVLRRSSLESGAEGGGGDGARLRRHKSLDGGEKDNFRKNENDYKTKDKKDPRLERRIRNKDRPAMEIYRPGMGRFSKQRLEREKSMNDDRASLSQSPTPSGSHTSANTKTSSKQIQNAQQAASPSSEVRSMTFKRSTSRDLP